MRFKTCISRTTAGLCNPSFVSSLTVLSRSFSSTSSRVTGCPAATVSTVLRGTTLAPLHLQDVVVDLVGDEPLDVVAPAL